CLIIIVAVLLQPGKSGDLGSMFGGGTSESIFGSSGAVPFLAKLTRVLGVVFFATSLFLGYFAIKDNSSSVLKGVGASTSGFEETFGTDSDLIGSLDDVQQEVTETVETQPADKPVENSDDGMKLKEIPEQSKTEKQTE
ncbi:MAG TPA: preprotein translocase subunit SecG, partial [Thermodesulfobacteriota bacterium]|nr:preprotein translocase subunit SecG [Thermodesulfobacteriota bacterium]